MASRTQRARPDARALAWDILQRVEAGAYADVLLGRRLDGSGLAARDRALATQLVYGTLAWQGYVDYLLGACAERPIVRLDPPVRAALRLAVYQMTRLTRIPPFAAVNSAVQLVKRHRAGSATGFVNAVLRRLAREWQQVPLPARTEDPVGFLSATLSHPRWLVRQWIGQYGIEATEMLLRANNTPAPTTLRVNRRRADPAAVIAAMQAEGYRVESALYSPVALRVGHGGSPDAASAYGEGHYSVQGEASQLVGFLLGVRPGDRVLDACAVPGGKATHLAELLDDRGVIVALDINGRGLQRLQRMTQRLHLSCVHPVLADTRACPLVAGAFDAVLVDAPCSGLGTLRAHPEIKWRRTAADIAALAELQRQILTRVATAVRAGGTLVYATCTMAAEENEQQVARFLETHPEFTVDDPRRSLPDAARGLVGHDGALRTTPHQHGLDGFFAVRLKRREARGIVRP